MFLSDGLSLVIYGNALPFTTNATFLTIVNKNIYNKKFPISNMYTTKIAQRLLHTERVTHFGLSSGRHMHAWRAYFYKMHGKAVQQRITKIEFLGNKRWKNADLQVHEAP